jgi:hypothetical protein
MTEHGKSDVMARHGNHLLKPGAASLWQPAYDQGPMTVRIHPGKNPEHDGSDPNVPYFDPYRFPGTDLRDPYGFGDFIRCYPAVRAMGDPPVTFIYHNSADENAGDKQMTPPWVLYRAIDRAVASGNDRQGWAALLRGGRGRGAQLPRPTEIYLVQCSIMMFKDRVYNPPKGFGAEDGTIVLELGRSAGKALLNELQREVENYQGNPDDFEARYANGDPVSLALGRFVTFYTLKQGDPRMQAAASSGGAAWSSPVQTVTDANGKVPLGYGCFMEPTFNGQAAALSHQEAAVRQQVRPWDDLLNFPSPQRQAELLADKFPAEIIEYAWRDQHPEWIPDEVARRARAAVTAQVPTPQYAAGQVGGMPQQAPVQADPYSQAAYPDQPAPAQQAPPQSSPFASAPVEQPAQPQPAAAASPFAAAQPQPEIPTPPAPQQPAGNMGWTGQPNPVAQQAPATQVASGLPSGTLPPANPEMPPVTQGQDSTPAVIPSEPAVSAGFDAPAPTGPPQDVTPQAAAAPPQEVAPQPAAQPSAQAEAQAPSTMSPAQQALARAQQMQNGGN